MINVKYERDVLGSLKEAIIMNEIIKDSIDGFSEIWRKLLGYFGREKSQNQGPSLLGMETGAHRKVPNADEINKAVEDAKKEVKRNKEQLSEY